MESDDDGSSRGRAQPALRLSRSSDFIVLKNYVLVRDDQRFGRPWQVWWLRTAAKLLFMARFEMRYWVAYQITLKLRAGQYQRWSLSQLCQAAELLPNTENLPVECVEAVMGR